MKTPRTLKDIQNDPRVERVNYEGEEDGYWVYLKDEYFDYDFDSFNPTHQIHEWSIKKLCQRFKGVRKANQS